MTTMTIGRSGEMTLPQEVQEQYGLGLEVSVRLIETRFGLLLVPLTDAPMSGELTRELEAGIRRMAGPRCRCLGAVFL